MPRPTLAPSARANNVAQAAIGINALIGTALALSEVHGYGSPAAQAAWAEVEMQGATIHRQSRILAGKSRGG